MTTPDTWTPADKVLGGTTKDLLDEAIHDFLRKESYEEPTELPVSEHEIVIQSGVVALATDLLSTMSATRIRYGRHCFSEVYAAPGAHDMISLSYGITYGPGCEPTGAVTPPIFYDKTEDRHVRGVWVDTVPMLPDGSGVDLATLRQYEPAQLSRMAAMAKGVLLRYGVQF